MAVVTEQDRHHLGRALALAEGGRGRVSPNPLVGAVIARGGDLVGEGFHAELGGEHAEVAAIEDARRRGNEVRGATLYVTLEPCAHHGRRSPCAPAVAAAGVTRVVIGCDDPSEKASGRGPGILRDEGVAVEFAEGAEAAAARLLVQPFRKHARTGLPLVIHKSAVSLDGRTATAAGDARWISGPQSRELVHRWRAEGDAVAVGIGTALADDPLLTARDVGAARQPRRIVFDSNARLPLDSRLVATVGEAPLIVVCGSEAPADRAAALRDAGAEVIAVPGKRAAGAPALAELGRRQVGSLLLEGGATLAGAFYAAGEIDQLRLFVAPLIVGGDAPPLVRGEGADRIAEATRALEVTSEQCGDDLLICARLKEW